MILSQITRFMGPTWGPPGSCRPQVGSMLAPWTLLSRVTCLLEELDKRNQTMKYSWNAWRCIRSEAIMDKSCFRDEGYLCLLLFNATSIFTLQRARFMGPTWGPPGSCRPKVGSMLAPWTLLSRVTCLYEELDKRNQTMKYSWNAWRYIRSEAIMDKSCFRDSGYLCLLLFNATSIFTLQRAREGSMTRNQ